MKGREVGKSGMTVNNVTVVLVKRGGRTVERHVSGLNETACRALEILGFDQTIIATPRKTGLVYAESSE